MTAQALLDRLEGVRRTGKSRWAARCPAHADKTPSLSIRELDDGRILLHDFAGCAVEQIVAAVGLTFADLMPPRPIEHAKGERRPFLPQDVFQIARQEIAVAAVVACDMHSKREISEADYKRLLAVVERLNDVAGAAYGRG